MTATESTAAAQPKTAIVFPGMGPSSFAEVGKFLMLDPFARKRLAEADEALGYSVFDRLRDSEDDYSEATQIAFLVNSMASADRAVEELGLVPEICVGPSFGQKAATAFVGSLPFPELVRLTAEMARYEIQYFTEEYQDAVTHTFFRTPREKLAEILAEFDERGEWYDYSGYLDEGFCMISLREKELEGLKHRVSQIGGYSMYTMVPAVHAPAFKELRRRVEEDVLPKYELADPKLPVVTDQDGTIIRTADALRTMLLDTFDLPIDWPKVVASLKAEQVAKVCIAGPDNLFHRLDTTKSNFEVVTVGPGKRARDRAPRKR
ncbi:ACP S-malonyltransferase [Streptomyces sp. LX-29]|uniref:ACP S-malonyltransferase n=1 Tax=unclassified Streptomyces TaxID=2593676 RepID=UPI0011861F2D|nr:MULTISPECIES: ACP S-malonyltransferase [unclassified Streptomyces]TVL91785.1 ACP S-malonyltransferase [Streptomyces sp. SAJ15]WFB09519.1 ACP S-malonyltransferase [Streptomyces sp. LX-29]